MGVSIDKDVKVLGAHLIRFISVIGLLILACILIDFSTSGSLSKLTEWKISKFKEVYEFTLGAIIGIQLISVFIIFASHEKQTIKES